MDSEQDVNFRLRLAEGFLQEAEEDLTLSRWRSCVDNAQLAVELLTILSSRALRRSNFGYSVYR
jgi:HEPN domain-containing protein